LRPDSGNQIFAPSLSSILIPPCVIPIPPLTPNPATQHLPAPPSRSPPKHAPTRTLTSHPTPSHPSLTHRPSPSNPPSPSRPSQPHPLCVYTHTVPYRTHQTRTQRMLCLTEYQYQYRENGIRRRGGAVKNGRAWSGNRALFERWGIGGREGVEDR